MSAIFLSVYNFRFNQVRFWRLTWKVHLENEILAFVPIKALDFELRSRTGAEKHGKMPNLRCLCGKAGRGLYINVDQEKNVYIHVISFSTFFLSGNIWLLICGFVVLELHEEFLFI